ncbi:hypothetical protein [Vibrio sp. 99-70-13A1]|uniref:hypothetical protein n=1 Tax=Vibrio sp. 99-70-13A1 TaxID=2607601 RepID=UPI00149362DB|nr:hypothetical protein [Vibrio sp. 99-70-13A1]NOH98823.1 hypothetical protein [Vibrio sp. 99-70-13A1]
MNFKVIFGIVSVLCGLFGASYLIVGGSHFPMSQWPQEAFQGLIFTIVWGFGVSKFVASAFSLLVFFTVGVVSYAIGFKLASFIPGQED